MGIEAYGDIVRCDKCGCYVMTDEGYHIKVFQSYEIIYTVLRRLRWYIDAEKVLCRKCNESQEIQDAP